MAKIGKNAGVIRWLNRYLEQQKESRELRQELIVLKDTNFLRSPELSDMPKGSRPNEGLEKYLLINAAVQKMLDESESREEQLYLEISDAINKIKDKKLRNVLRYRYLIGWKWDVIADEMDFTLDYAKGKLHGRALEEIKRIHKNTFECDTV